MYLEAITVSVNYPDYLDRIAVNRPHFDRWLIVTHEDDQRTIDVCRRHKLEYLCSRRLHENGAPFARGKAVNEGLAVLDKRDWLLLLDSDVLLAPDFRQSLDRQTLRKDCIYGLSERCIALTESHIRRARFPRTIVSTEILGFFQLFHSSHTTVYPEVSSSAGLDDQIFASSWPPDRQILLEDKCVHLGETDINWEHRITPTFGRILNPYMVFKYSKMGIRKAINSFCVRRSSRAPAAKAAESPPNG